MADIIDNANDIADEFLLAALSNKKKDGPADAGRCHFCGMKTKRGRRWCDADCRDSWQRREDLRARGLYVNA